MRGWTMAAMLAAGMLLGTALVPKASASQWNEQTYLSFSQPVEVPGMVLPAGRYEFKLLDSEADRNIVQIFNRQGTRLYATIMAIPDYRLRPTGKTVIMFEERAAGAPQAIKAWFYPGDNYGQQFVYPKARAITLAKATNQPVPSMPTEMSSSMTKPALTAKSPEVAAMKKAPLMAQKPSGEETQVAQVFTPPPPSARRHLPKTASEFPLFGLLGVLSLGLAGGLRLVRKTAA
jgi:hypothetical protein